MRAPPALKAFPTLVKFKTLYPRTNQFIPIAHTGKPTNRQNVIEALGHIYSDLGVLAFAGADYRQTDRIGGIVKRLVDFGGPGKLAAELLGLQKSRRVLKPGQAKVHKTFRGERYVGWGVCVLGEPIG